MDQTELYNKLKEIELPLSYSHFDDYQEPPFLIYLFSYSDDFMADDSNYLDISKFQIELYTNKKDLTAEKKVEDKLKEINLPYLKYEEWIDTEKVYQVLYEITLI